MLKPYDGYKETTIPWLEEVPSHWESKKINELFKERKSKVSDKDFAPLSVTKKGIVPQLSNAAKSNDSDNRKLVCEGDFVINSRSDRKGSSGISPLTGSVSLINIVLEPRKQNNSKFMHHLLKSNSFIEEYYRNGRGIVADLWTTRYSEMKTITLPVPPREEQDQIVKYLDWQISKISTLIKAKKKQIELLKEQKQAVINRAVTKGLDDTVPMKDGGVAWLGEVPEHWVVKPLKYFASSNDESLSNLESDDFELNYIDISTVGFTYLKMLPVRYKFKDAPSRARRIVRRGDTIISTVRTYLKSMCYIDEELDNHIASTGFSVLRPNSSVFPKLLAYSLSCDYFVNQISRNSIGVSYPAISDSKLLGIKIALPETQNEQIKIYELVQEKTTLIDKAIAVIEKEIELVSEYKTSLISSVVTGKVDVRDVVVPDFEVVEDEISEDEGLEVDMDDSN